MPSSIRQKVLESVIENDEKLSEPDLIASLHFLKNHPLVSFRLLKHLTDHLLEKLRENPNPNFLTKVGKGLG